MQLDDFSYSPFDSGAGYGVPDFSGAPYDTPMLPDMGSLNTTSYPGLETFTGQMPPAAPAAPAGGGIGDFFGGMSMPSTDTLLKAILMGTVGLGGAGAIQNLTRPAPQTTQRTTRQVAPPGPQEQMLQGQMMQTVQNPWLQQMQQQMMAGQLPVNPAMMDALAKANAGLYSGIQRAGLEDLRARGFTGASLGTGMTPGYNQSMQDANLAASQQLYQMIMGLPQMASGIGAQQAGSQQALLNSMIQQRLQGAPSTTVTQAPKPGLLESITPAMGAIGGALGAYGQYGRQPSLASA